MRTFFNTRKALLALVFFCAGHTIAQAQFTDVIGDIEKYGMVTWYSVGFHEFGTIPRLGAAIKYGPFTLFETKDTPKSTFKIKGSDSIFTVVIKKKTPETQPPSFDTTYTLQQVTLHTEKETKRKHYLTFNLSLGYQQFYSISIGKGEPIKGDNLSTGGPYFGIFVSPPLLFGESSDVRLYAGLSSTLLSEASLPSSYTGTFRIDSLGQQRDTNLIGLPIKTVLPATATWEAHLGFVVFDNFMISLTYHNLRYKNVSYKTEDDKNILTNKAFITKAESTINLSHVSLLLGLNFDF